MNILTVSNARAKLLKLVQDVEKYDERFIITSKGKPKAVLLSVDDLESLEETNKILSIPGALESIKRGEKQAKQGKGITLEELIEKYK